MDRPSLICRLLKQMHNGGHAAMLHDLLSLDISTFDIRSPPITAGLNEQKKLSGNVHERWWRDMLYRGYVFSSEHGHEHIFGHWTEAASFLLLYNAYQAYAKENRKRHLLGREAFDAFMLTTVKKKVRLREAPVKERREGPVRQLRPRGLRFGPLTEARTTFCSRTTLAMDWPEAEDGPAFTLTDTPGDADDEAA